VAVIFSICVGLVIAYDIVNEDHENDSMPKLLSSEIKMSKLRGYPATNYISPEDCIKNARIQEYLAQQKYAPADLEGLTCSSFSLNAKQKLSFITSDALSVKQSLFLANENQQLNNVVQVGSDYPGNRITDIKGNGSAVFFTFDGWNNPKKVIELQLAR